MQNSVFFHAGYVELVVIRIKLSAGVSPGIASFRSPAESFLAVYEFNAGAFTGEVQGNAQA
ncbi:hypothetical protein AA310_04170 [Arthrobacter sp. YC-RL1]|nr:hypothetical protein ATC04_14735 [Arthrobacter sp. YC-RL1]KLI89848.1 hypothetical protein AA310_04170 [Arthrobacter sp. YC-RL1]